MRNKMKLPFLFKTVAVDAIPSASSWSWASCHQPKTLSFRADMFKTMNSAFLEETPESWFSKSSESASLSSTSEGDEATGGDLTETVIRGVKSERLLFSGGETNSILEEVKVGESAALKESLVISVESRDPYGDFRESMAEMVEGHGLREWDDLEELLGWYLRLNSKATHPFIVGAFIDLLLPLSLYTCSSPSPLFLESSPLSPSSSHPHTL